MPKCETCDFSLDPVLRRTDNTLVWFYNDARFPGRCIVSLQEHYEHFDDVPVALQAALWTTASDVGSAQREVIGAPRINYALMGNVVPHVHVHVIPRGASPADINPGRPPWEDAAPKVELPERDAKSLWNSLYKVLNL